MAKGFKHFSILVGQILLSNLLANISVYHPTIEAWRHNHEHKVNNNLNSSSERLIMWGSRPLMTVSTANRLVLNTLQRLYIFTHKSRKNSEEL
jgi:hypothetical protein